MTISVQQIPELYLSLLWADVGPFLIEGASVDSSLDIKSAIDDVFEGRARVWMIVDGERITAAFLTSVVTNEHSRSLDVFGLGGKNILRWGRALTEAMTEYAIANECEKIIFKGRKALQRAYPGIRPIWAEADGTIRYERALSS